MDEVMFFPSIAAQELQKEKEVKVGLWQIAEAIPSPVMRGNCNTTTSSRNSQFKHS